MNLILIKCENLVFFQDQQAFPESFRGIGRAAAALLRQVCGRDGSGFRAGLRNFYQLNFSIISKRREVEIDE